MDSGFRRNEGRGGMGWGGNGGVGQRNVIQVPAFAGMTGRV